MRIELEKQTLDHFFYNSVKKYSSNKALAFVGEEPLTYKEFGEQVDSLKKKLKSFSVKKGQKILLLGDNSPNWCFAFMAITTMGAVVVPVLVDFPEADINHIIRHSEAAAAFISDSIYTSMDLTPLSDFKIVFSLTDFSILVQQEQAEKEEKKSKETEKEKSGSEVEIQEDDLAEILYTSGTTGHSKGVMLAHKSLVSNGMTGIDSVKAVNEDSIVLSLLPLAHSYGSTSTFLGAVYAGAVLYFLKRKPSPKILIDAMQKLKPTVLTGVPLVFEKIYHKRVLPEISKKKLLRWLLNFKVSRKFLYRTAGKKVMEMFGGRLECAVIGGAALNPEVEAFLRDGRIPFTNGYGLSECAPLVSASPVAETRIGSVGKPAGGVDIKIVNPEPDTGIGEIYVKGPNVMQGYYKNPEENEKVFSEDGWLITGDRGYLDKDNYLFIRGRSKTLILGPSGENIFPEVVEEKLKESPYVEEALVYDDDGKITARIYPDYDFIDQTFSGKSEAQMVNTIRKLLEDIRKETNTKLPAFSQVSRIIEQEEPFEKTPTNKIKRLLYLPK
ncbi:MAG TPA: long-chain fatty acid--CoA ligase [Bacteroidetes bacterium]|nr:long-chain fatty acid--CoA ligase [Bacteroidota bacterium]